MQFRFLFVSLFVVSISVWGPLQARTYLLCSNHELEVFYVDGLHELADRGKIQLIREGLVTKDPAYNLFSLGDVENVYGLESCESLQAFAFYRLATLSSHAEPIAAFFDRSMPELEKAPAETVRKAVDGILVPRFEWNYLGSVLMGLSRCRALRVLYDEVIAQEEFRELGELLTPLIESHADADELLEWEDENLLEIIALYSHSSFLKFAKAMTLRLYDHLNGAQSLELTKEMFETHLDTHPSQYKDHDIRVHRRVLVDLRDPHIIQAINAYHSEGLFEDEIDEVIVTGALHCSEVERGLRKIGDPKRFDMLTSDQMYRFATEMHIRFGGGVAEETDKAVIWFSRLMEAFRQSP